ncbi:unnamed protein product [Lota lota]
MGRLAHHRSELLQLTEANALESRLQSRTPVPCKPRPQEDAPACFFVMCGGGRGLGRNLSLDRRNTTSHRMGHRAWRGGVPSKRNPPAATETEEYAVRCSPNLDSGEQVTDLEQ